MNGSTPMRRRALTLALVGSAVVGLAACSTRAPSDMIVLYYEAGAGDDKKFLECIEPGTSGSYPMDDEIFALPTSLRTWNIRPEGGDTDQPIKSGTLPVSIAGGGSQPGAEVVVYATADFYINTDCGDGEGKKDDEETTGYKSPVVKFWESAGRRYGISVDGENGFNLDNFRTLLLNTLVPAEETAIRAETRRYNADALDANLNNVWQTMERNLAPGFARSLREKLGGDYFCGVGYEGGRETTWTGWRPVVKDDKPVLNAENQPTYEEVEETGTCPPVRITITDVSFADPEATRARARVYSAEQNAKADLVDAEAQRDRARLLEQAGNSPAYIELQRIEAQKAAAEACAQKGADCTVIIDGRGNTLIPPR